MGKRKEEANERVELLEIRFYSSERWDKQIVFINGGALFLSMGFLENVVDMGKSSFNCVLICAWGLFTCSLVINLLSHNLSIKAVDARIIGDDYNSVRIDRKTQLFNKISLVTLFVGLL